MPLVINPWGKWVEKRTASRSQEQNPHQEWVGNGLLEVMRRKRSLGL